MNNFKPRYSLRDVWKFKHLQPTAPLKMLFSFREPTSIENFNVITDGIFGGKSTATCVYDTELPLDLTEKDEEILRLKLPIPPGPKRKKYTLEDYFEGIKEIELDQEMVAAIEEKEITPDVDPSSLPLVGSARFSGNISLDLPNPKVQRSGFACLQSLKYYPRLNLEGYHALEIRLQTDGRIYVAQMKTDTAMEDDLYQMILPPLTPKKWHRIVLPFTEFILTNRGYSEEEQPPMELYNLQHVGILMAERANGPFWINIDWIRVIKLKDYEYLRRIQ